MGAKSTKWFSIFPNENYELLYGNWEKSILIDPEVSAEIGFCFLHFLPISVQLGYHLSRKTFYSLFFRLLVTLPC
jgi:hypothetical protein